MTDTLAVTISPYLDLGVHHRHWAASSQAYAPGDVLFHYLNSGWGLEQFVMVETFYFSENRHVDVLQFTLIADDEQIIVPVVANPAICRLVEEKKLVPLYIRAVDVEFLE